LYRLAAVGDGYVGPFLHAKRGASGLERWFVDGCFVNWLRVLMPEAELPERSVFGDPGTTTVALAKRLKEILALAPQPQAALICVGTEDCMASTRGGAPSPEASAGALAHFANELAAGGVRPIFIIPPPNIMFANGLFADRFIALAAILRRICRVDDRFALIDPTSALMKPRAFGVEPDPRFAKAVDPGRLTDLGAFRLAQDVAERLRVILPLPKGVRSIGNQAAVNANPYLNGRSGAIRCEAITGRCPTGYRIDSHGLGGARVKVSRSAGDGRRLQFAGAYSTGWGFVRLSQEIGADTLDTFSPGDAIEARCDMRLEGSSASLAAVCLNVTAVWENDYVALCSGRYVGGPGLGEDYAGCLQTPAFTPPGRLKKLHVALQAHLAPAENTRIDASVDIGSVVLRKLPSAAIN
jgi:hypothetical protein